MRLAYLLVVAAKVCISTPVIVPPQVSLSILAFRQILAFENAKNIIVLQDFNKILIHHDGYLLSYSLEVLARVAQYQSPASALDASLETIAGQDGSVILCEAGTVKGRTVGKCLITGCRTDHGNETQQ